MWSYAFQKVCFIHAILLLLCLCLDGSPDVGVTNNISNVAHDDMTIYQPGDVLGRFKLFDRIDALGIKRLTSKNLRTRLTHDKPPPSIGANSIVVDMAPNGMYTSIASVDSSDSCVRINAYCLGRKFFVGGHGEVWRAYMYLRDHLTSDTPYVLKRMIVKDRPHISKCALREIYFGDLLRGSSRVARYETFFIHGDDYWLVFRDEGVSLHQLLYTMKITDDNAMLEASTVWYKLRSSRNGNKLLKGLMHEIIQSVESLHASGILHRDIKPANILLNGDRDGIVKVLMIDFSSAVNAESLSAKLYGVKGPSLEEASVQYIPPECILGQAVAFDEAYPMSYDVWSIGIVFLEVLLGTADVFSVDQRTLAMLTYRLRNTDEKTVSDALLLAALADYCIYRPSDGNVRGKKYSPPFGDTTDSIEDLVKLFTRRARPVRCSVEQMAQAIQSRDPLRIGFHDAWGLDLLYRMLSFNPRDRISLKEALEHAYFNGPYASGIDGSLHGTRGDVVFYDCILETNSDVDECTARMEGLRKDFQLKDMSDTKGSELLLPRDVDSGAGKVETVSSVTDKMADSFALARPEMERLLCVPSDTLEYQDDGSEVLCGLSPYRRQDETLVINEFIDSIGELANDIRCLIPRFTKDNYGTCPLLPDDRRISPKLLDDEESWTVLDVSRSSDSSMLPKLSLTSVPDDSNSDEPFAAIINDDFVFKNISFQCPVCGRSFKGSYDSCLQHTKIRNHGHRCSYSTVDGSELILPECISEHSMLPIDPSSGWCDLIGRRLKMEDAHAVVFSDEPNYKYFAVFDGHFGHSASHFASEHLHSYFDDALLQILADPRKQQPMEYRIRDELGLDKATSNSWREKFLVTDTETPILAKLVQEDSDAYHYSEKQSTLTEKDGSNTGAVTESSAFYSVADVSSAIHTAFESLHTNFMEFAASMSDQSGSTATVALLFSDYLMIAHVGDSRAVLCCGENAKAIQLTIDHSPDLFSEKNRIEAAGGFVSKGSEGRINRVNGKLAVSRSFGDLAFAPNILSHIPDTLVLARPKRDHSIPVIDSNGDNGWTESFHVFSSCNAKPIDDKNSSLPDYDFVILASDGLWEVVSNQEAVTFVCDYLKSQMMLYVPDLGDWEGDITVSSQYLPPDSIHNAARQLALEAYVRGSGDNIGVCIVEVE